MANLFIVIEGMDGSGKSEIVKMLHNYLFSKKKYRILTTREPTSGTYGKRIREMLRLDEDTYSNKDALLDLFIKDREEHLKNTIIPFLSSKSEELHIVLCDRYYHSTIAFQHAQGIPLDELIKKNSKFLKPDIIFILDIEPETALKRISGRKKEKFEQLEFMKRLRNDFKSLKKILNDNIRLIDASKPFDEVFSDVTKYIDELLE